MTAITPTPASRGLAAAGAVLAAAAIALSAYAMHAAGAQVGVHLQMAALFAFGHGVALAMLAPTVVRGLARVALAAMLLGVLMFSGSLLAAHLFGAPTRLVPYGGGFMILAWLLFAADAVRR
jgi:uncharacterized membrane protein YgdD (TMEM256/DUF423 family)